MKPTANSSFKNLSQACSFCCLAISISAIFIAPALADGTSTSMEWATALKNVYKSNQTSSNATANNQAINQNGLSNNNCKSLLQAKQNAASAYVVSRVPPNPTTVIQNSTCFIDVMDIAIPVTGNSFLDTLVQQFSPFLRSSACQIEGAWWGNMKQQMLGGKFGQLNNSFETALKAVSSANNVISYVAAEPGEPVQANAGLFNVGMTYSAIKSKAAVRDFAANTLNQTSNGKQPNLLSSVQGWNSNNLTGGTLSQNNASNSNASGSQVIPSTSSQATDSKSGSWTIESQVNQLRQSLGLEAAN